MDNYRHNIRHELEELIGTDFTENTVLINIYRVNPRNPCLFINYQFSS